MIIFLLLESFGLTPQNIYVERKTITEAKKTPSLSFFCEGLSVFSINERLPPGISRARL